MKNLLSRFRKKASEAPNPQESPEAPAAQRELAKGSAEPASTPAPLPAATPAPQTAMARGIKPAWHRDTTPPAVRKRQPALAGPTAPAEKLTLTLGDFLDRIPTEFLDGEEHDRATPLPFDLGALSERIGRGETEIPLTDIYKRIPDIFRADTVIGADRMVRFPWRRFRTMVEEARGGTAVSGLTAAAVEALSVKVKARKLLKPSKMAPAVANSARPNPTKEAGPAEGAAESTQPPPLSLVPRSEPVEEAAEETPTPVRAAAPVPMLSPASSLLSPDLDRLKAAFEKKLAALKEERDKAVADVDPLRQQLAEQAEAIEAERKRAAAALEELELLQKGGAGQTLDASANEADAKAALARTAEMAAERDSALARSAELTAERDSALARSTELAAEREATLARATELTAERDAALARANELTGERDAALARSTEPDAEREAALARATELATELDAALARATEITAERDAALARANELTAERDAAVARAAELATERDAALARATEIAAERDGALARSNELTAELTAERDVSFARAAELTAERDAALANAGKLVADSEAAVALASELTAERDAIAARLADLTAERDAAVGCAAEVLEGAQAAPETEVSPDHAEWMERATAQLQEDIETLRARIKTLLRERDERRDGLEVSEVNQVSEVSEKTVDPIVATETPEVTEPAVSPLAGAEKSDAYSAIFPERQKARRRKLKRGAVATVLAIVGMGLGIAVQPKSSSAPTALAKSLSGQLASDITSVEADPLVPAGVVLPDVSLVDGKFSMETAVAEPAVTFSVPTRGFEAANGSH